MKLKTDFITNSSSASYIVFIPDDFDIQKFFHLITETEINEVIEYSSEWGDARFENNEDVYRSLKNQVKELVSSGSVFQDNEFIYFILAGILEKLDLVISEPETGGGDGSGCIMNIAHKSSRKKLKNILNGGWGLKHGGWGIETKI